MSVDTVMKANAKWARALSACQRSEYAALIQRNTETIQRLLGEVESLGVKQVPDDLSLDQADVLDRLVAFNRNLGKTLLSGAGPAPMMAERLAELLVLNADAMDALREQVALLFLKLQAPAAHKRRLS